MQASLHDSSWLRRPRSRSHAASRSATPLSRQNSMSMDELPSSASFARPIRSAMGARVPRRAAAAAAGHHHRSHSQRNGYHVRQASSSSILSKSASVDDGLDYESDSGIVVNKGRNRYYDRDPSPTKVDYSSDREGTPSPTKGSSGGRGKSVAFVGVPDVDRETPRMLNGTPVRRKSVYL